MAITVLYPFGIFLTLVGYRYPTLAIVGWLITILCVSTDTYLGIYAGFFYTSFFLGSGLLQQSLFTIKHFHLLIFILFFTQFLRKSFFQTWLYGLKQSKSLIPIFLILTFSTIGARFAHSSIKSYRIVLNLLLVIGAMIFMMGLIESKKIVLRKSIFAFILGVSLQMLIGLHNLVFNTNYLQIQLIHSNHFGMLTAATFFYCLYFIATERKPITRWLHILIGSLVFLGLVLSFSRTSWISFFISYLILFILVIFCQQGQKFRHIFMRRVLIITALMVALAGYAIISLELWMPFIVRIKSIPALWTKWYWQYALHDQNFGFFGAFRLRQFYELKDILGKHFWFGIGFEQVVVDFHSFYFTILGASGIIGLIIFILFCANLIGKLIKSIFNERHPRAFLSKVTCLCFLSTWLIASTMESLFLQFYIWTGIVATILLIRQCPRVK